MVAPWRGEDILSASSNWLQVQSQSSSMSRETSSETLVQYSVTVAAISGFGSLLATHRRSRAILLYQDAQSLGKGGFQLTVKERTLVNMIAVGYSRFCAEQAGGFHVVGSVSCVLRPSPTRSVKHGN